MIDKSLQINNIEIPHPEMWRLALRINRDGVKYALYSTVEDNTLIFEEIPLTQSGEKYLKRLENLFYDHPQLLKEYKHVDILLDTEEFTLVPPIYNENKDDEEAIFRYLHPNFEGDILSNKIPQCGNASLVFGIGTDVHSFIKRTFFNFTIRHKLTPLCQYFGKKSQLGNVSKLYAHFEGDQIDICAFSKQGLLCANSFTFHSINDAVYYILGVWNAHKLDVMTDELQISGDKNTREKIMPMLREYITFVMPSIFPSSLFKMGNDAMNAPFELIIQPLCE